MLAVFFLLTTKICLNFEFSSWYAFGLQIRKNVFIYSINCSSSPIKKDASISLPFPFRQCVEMMTESLINGGNNANSTRELIDVLVPR